MFVWIFLGAAALLAWAFLLFCRHGFWRAQPTLDQQQEAMQGAPSVAVVIPARDEAETIGRAVRSLLAQDYPGQLDLLVVDDQSSDDTAMIVDALMPEAGPGRTLERITNTDRPNGWSGKLWAIKAGLDRLDVRGNRAAVLLLTDADIAHDLNNVSALVKKMVNEQLDAVSLMVRLHNRSFWERLLIPPFIFFFAMLYPFAAVNRPDHHAAATAGGCILLRRDALRDAGGIEAIKDALIDDVALGRLIKARPNGRRRIWLGYGERTVSFRAYDDLLSIWRMVTRTADTQLDHSLLNLLVTVVGMAVIYLLPPLLVLSWPFHQGIMLSLLGLTAWLMMSFAFWPTLKLYQASLFWAPTLPFAALLYTAMTIDSARQFRQGRGGLWKGRVFPG